MEKQPPLILASASPRRRDLLSKAGFDFDVWVPDIEERPRKRESAPAYVIRNAREKVRFAAENPETFIIGADTIVVLDEDILEKPKDPSDAKAMLARLSGRSHQVMTGFAISQDGIILEDHVISTDVTFKTLRPNEIAEYVATGEPADKAGSYAIQGLAAYMVREINGSYTNVVGFPMTEVVEALERSFVR